MAKRSSSELKELVTQIAAAKAGGDEALRSELLKQFMDARDHERASVYRQTVPMYPVADEFGLATEMVESAAQQLERLAQAEPALRGLYLRAELVHSFMIELLDEIDEITEAAGEAIGVPLD